MLASCLLSATLALLAPHGDDVLVVDVPRHEVRLPESLSVTLSGSVKFAVDDDGASFVRLPDDARVMLHGEPVEGRIEVAAGDSILVLSSSGDLTISVNDPVTKRVADAFASAVGVGRGAGGLGRLLTQPLLLGVSTTPLGEALSAQLELAPEDALLVVQVPDGLPAAEAGVLPYDVIVALDGERPVDQEVLRDVMSRKAVGDVVTVSLLRAGKALDLDVTLTARESNVLGSFFKSKVGGADAFGGGTDVFGGDAAAFGADAAAYAESLARMADQLAERAELESAAVYLETTKNAYATASEHKAQLEARLAQLAHERDGAQTGKARAELERALADAAREQAELERDLVRNEAALADVENSFADKVRGLTRSRAQLEQLQAMLAGVQRRGADGRDLEIVDGDDGQRALLLGNRVLGSSREDGSPWNWLAPQGASLEQQHELSERVESRLDGVEERLARIEAMLEKLLAAKAH